MVLGEHVSRLCGQCSTAGAVRWTPALRCQARLHATVFAARTKSNNAMVYPILNCLHGPINKSSTTCDRRGEDREHAARRARAQSLYASSSDAGRDKMDNISEGIGSTLLDERGLRTSSSDAALLQPLSCHTAATLESDHGLKLNEMSDAALRVAFSIHAQVLNAPEHVPMPPMGLTGGRQAARASLIEILVRGEVYV